EVVVCKVPEFTWRNRLQPLEQKRRPATPYAAKFSVPFGVAVTLIRGEAGLEAFTEHTIRDKEILALVDRIEFELEPERFSEFPAYYSGWIEATTADGSTLVSQVAYNRGSDRNPLSDADYDVKFREAASTVLTGDAGEAILRTARSIESSTVADLLSVLTG